MAMSTKMSKHKTAMQNEIGYSGSHTKTNRGANSERERPKTRSTYNSGNEQASVSGEVPKMHLQVCLFLLWSHTRSEIHSADSIYLATATTVLKQHCCMCACKRARMMMNARSQSCGAFDMLWIGGPIPGNITKTQLCFVL